MCKYLVIVLIAMFAVVSVGRGQENNSNTLTNLPQDFASVQRWAAGEPNPNFLHTCAEVERVLGLQPKTLAARFQTFQQMPLAESIPAHVFEMTLSMGGALGKCEYGIPATVGQWGWVAPEGDLFILGGGYIVARFKGENPPSAPAPVSPPLTAAVEPLVLAAVQVMEQREQVAVAAESESEPVAAPVVEEPRPVALVVEVVEEVEEPAPTPVVRRRRRQRQVERQEVAKPEPPPRRRHRSASEQTLADVPPPSPIGKAIAEQAESMLGVRSRYGREGCVDVASTILDAAGTDVPHMTGVSQMYKHLRSSSEWVRIPVAAVTEGDVLIAPQSGKQGHVLIVASNGNLIGNSTRRGGIVAVGDGVMKTPERFARYEANERGNETLAFRHVGLASD